MVNKGDLLLALYGATSGDISISRINGAINQAILCIRPKHLNAYFIKSLWESHKKQILETYLQGGQGNLSSEIIKNISFIFPNIEEQNKISELVRKIDKRIETQSKIIEEQETLLKSLADKLFNTLDTVTKLHLSDISELYQPKTIPLSNLSSKGYPVYGANGIIGSYKNFNHTTEQICIACRGSSCGSVNYTVPKAWITGNAMVVNTDNYSNIIDKRYLYYYLRRINYSALISGSGQPQIVRAPLANLIIPVSTLEKQKHVVLILDTVGQILGTNKIILQHYKNQKAYLLSRMFI